MSYVLKDYKGLLLVNIKYKISLILYIALHTVLKILKYNFGIIFLNSNARLKTIGF